MAGISGVKAQKRCTSRRTSANVEDLLGVVAERRQVEPVALKQGVLVVLHVHAIELMFVHGQHVLLRAVGGVDPAIFLAPLLDLGRD